MSLCKLACEYPYHILLASEDAMVQGVLGLKDLLRSLPWSQLCGKDWIMRSEALWASEHVWLRLAGFQPQSSTLFFQQLGKRKNSWLFWRSWYVLILFWRSLFFLWGSVPLCSRHAVLRLHMASDSRQVVAVWRGDVALPNVPFQQQSQTSLRPRYRNSKRLTEETLVTSSNSMQLELC